MKRKNIGKLSGKTAVLVGIVVGSVLAAAVGYFVLVGPKRAEASRLAEEVATVEQTIADYRAASRNPQQPIEFAELFALTKAMPDTPDLPGILLELSRVAEDAGISITSVFPQGTQPVAGYQRLPLDVTFEGDFYNLSDFVYRLRTLVSVRDGKLEANGRLFAVDSVKFFESQKKFPQLQATLTLTAFTYLPQAAGAADGAATPGADTTPTDTGAATATAMGETN